MSKTVLKPCPFCGSDVSVLWVDIAYRKKYQVFCMNESCKGNSQGLQGRMFDTARQAKKAWGSEDGDV